MAKKQNKNAPEEVKETQTPEVETETQTQNPAAETEQQLAEAQDRYLRLAAEYDNFRKRSRTEREALYTEIKAETVGKFLPVFDNLQRALEQETADEAYKKGVEMTMTGLREIMTGLGVAEFGETGEPFDPTMHNAVMHCEDESVGENTIVEVFQKGFRVGERVVRFAMVRVAN
ncbi:MAG: nucleotide exchange factor GrpE [Oscillospiraceae bacterium]|nr:nucleotide exchange factor GrpE [Oscillospiraceae bacterium]MBR2366493.1 nucleotide exchange factor GrpE [Oscillospiraceae bacterium]MBR2897144.1 nucleotide exchange factor GrpE [Oscillospiraceae bacterium]MBR2977615.1 nucleotide exchange factor GrpE [Oscillospiraceae bacterium]MBR3849285.1 nucleotide exchange factor GrpE [Oscillospiraceae bacterium]